ncbi:MAG: protein kinase, partial [Sandaracinaceae bacterium]|nr:protein kinase [Sandaracinaceae bacterium]
MLPEPVAWIGMQGALGLDHLHQRRGEGEPFGVIHRDVSLDNLFLDIRGDVKLSDLGLGKALVGHAIEASLTTHRAGKPRYMPPEQYDGLPLDPRADLYALGVALYTLLSSAPLYDDPARPNEDVSRRIDRARHTERPPMRAL